LFLYVAFNDELYDPPIRVVNVVNPYGELYFETMDEVASAAPQTLPEVAFNGYRLYANNMVMAGSGSEIMYSVCREPIASCDTPGANREACGQMVAGNDWATLAHATDPNFEVSDQFAWSNFNAAFLGLSAIPSEPYPLDYVMELRLYGNDLRSVPGLSSIKGAAVINLSGNQLEDLSGLANLEYVSSLDLSDNPLQTLDGLHTLRAVDSLYIRGTNLSNIDRLRDVPVRTLCFDQYSGPRLPSGSAFCQALTQLPCGGTKAMVCE
jgi:hypothetical protein